MLVIQWWQAVLWAVGFGVLGGTIGVLVFSITAVSKNDFGRDEPAPYEPHGPFDDSGGKVPPSFHPVQAPQLTLQMRPPRRQRLLTAKQAARRLKMSSRWLYEHKTEFPFTVRLGARSVRFDGKMLDEWTARGWAPLKPGLCRECGCSEEKSCVVHGKACTWADATRTLCTRCLETRSGVDRA